jgi:hypothetical protein
MSGLCRYLNKEGAAPRCGAQMPEFTRGKGGAKKKGRQAAAADEDEEGGEGEGEVSECRSLNSMHVLHA